MNPKKKDFLSHGYIDIRVYARIRINFCERAK